MHIKQVDYDNPIEASAVGAIERSRDEILKWSYSQRVFLPNGTAEEPEGPAVGEIFRQADLKATLEKLVAAEREALAAGADRKAAIYAAYDRFYRGDIAEELVRGTQEEGGLITMEDLGFCAKGEGGSFVEGGNIPDYSLT